MSLNVNRRKLAVKVFCLLSFVLGGLVIAAPYALAQVDTSQQQQVVSDFATFIINILTGPVSKILGAMLLIGGVVALLNGKQGVAIACGFGFMILMFIPNILQGLFKQ
jgi:hypothetical protein